MSEEILDTDIEERIKNIQKQVQKYNKSSLQNKSTEKNTFLEENIKEHLNQLDELEQILNNPASIKKTNTDFEKIHHKMEKISNMDTNKMSITERIKVYLKGLNLLQLSEYHTKNNKIEEIIIK